MIILTGVNMVLVPVLLPLGGRVIVVTPAPVHCPPAIVVKDLVKEPVALPANIILVPVPPP